jgi:hypothetical protein
MRQLVALYDASVHSMVCKLDEKCKNTRKHSHLLITYHRQLGLNGSLTSRMPARAAKQPFDLSVRASISSCRSQYLRAQRARFTTFCRLQAVFTRHGLPNCTVWRNFPSTKCKQAPLSQEHLHSTAPASLLRMACSPAFRQQ